jgi:hypothetical protein
MKKRNLSDTDAQFFSKQPYNRQCVTETACALNDQIWPALVILWERQSIGIQTQIADMFPLPSISDRTRMLYVRLMVKRGYLNPVLPALNLQSTLSLSEDTQQRFMEAGYLDIAK